jgi:hypothetical protein
LKRILIGTLFCLLDIAFANRTYEIKEQDLIEIYKKYNIEYLGKQDDYLKFKFPKQMMDDLKRSAGRDVQ